MYTCSPTSKYLLLILMTLPPADDDKMKKNRTSGTPTSKKTSDSASSSKVRRTKVKLKFSETNFCKSYGPASEWRSMPDPPISDICYSEIPHNANLTFVKM